LLYLTKHQITDFPYVQFNRYYGVWKHIFEKENRKKQSFGKFECFQRKIVMTFKTNLD